MCGKNTAMFTFLRERNSQRRASSFETEYDGDKKPEVCYFTLRRFLFHSGLAAAFVCYPNKNLPTVHIETS